MSSEGGALPTLRAFRDELTRKLVETFAAPTDGSGAAVFRVAFGLLSLVTTVGVAMNVARWFSETGIMPARTGNVAWTLFKYAPAAPWMGTLHVALMAAGSAMLILGLWPRLGAFAVFVAHTSLQHRTPQILNSGDRLFAIVALLAVTLPLARRWSVEAWWRRRRGVVAPMASSWGMRLIQVQIAYVYANTATSKVMNLRWRNGRALYDVLASPVFAEWPAWLDLTPLIAAMTWGTLVFELGFPLLVWFRKARPWVLLAGVLFHLSIDVLMIIPMFSWIMIVSYGAFLDDELVHRAERWLGLRRAEVAPAAEGPVKDDAPGAPSSPAATLPADSLRPSVTPEEPPS